MVVSITISLLIQYNAAKEPTEKTPKKRKSKESADEQEGGKEKRPRGSSEKKKKAGKSEASTAARVLALSSVDKDQRSTLYPPPSPPSPSRLVRAIDLHFDPAHT